MEPFVFAFFVPAAAYLLDVVLGDPKNFPHPVRYIGNALDYYESSARRVGISLRAAGWFAVLFFSASVWGIAEFFMAIPYLGVIVAIYLGYAGLAMGCLARDARRVAALLDSGDLEGARSALGMLVSRDTSKLDAHQIRASLAETISENLNDGFVAPMFYLTILGPGGMWAYKAVSTMDSMWGYKTQKYKELGFAAAKTDDWLAYIPARITAWLLLWVGKKYGYDYETAKTHFMADAEKMESPNAGWPMAAAAWLFQKQMGGKTCYFGEIKDKPILGVKGKLWEKQSIQQLVIVCKSTAQLAAWSFIVLFGWLQLMF